MAANFSIISAVKYAGALASQYIPVLNQITAPVGLKVLALAHTKMEGFYPGSKAYRTNNPGNIGTSPLMGTTGKYPTLKDGVAAQISYLQRVINKQHKAYPSGGDTTLAKYLYTYAPPQENKTENYISAVIKTFADHGIKIDRNTKLKDLLSVNATSDTGTDVKKKINSILYNNPLSRVVDLFVW